MSTKEPRYLFGQDEANNLIHINDAISKQIYCCPGCGTRLVAYKNGKKQQHFKHYEAIACNGETYLHRTAKIAFYNWYLSKVRSAEPVTIKLKRKVNCSQYSSISGQNCISEELAEFNLTKYFDTASLEKKYGEFTPDILLSSSKSDEALFIEVAVTHPCEQAKIESGIRIIEFQLHSEEDIQSTLLSLPFTPNDGSVKAYNLTAKPLELNTCPKSCDSMVTSITIDHQGAVKVLKSSLKEAMRASSDRLAAKVIVDTTEDTLYQVKKALVEAKRKGVKRPNCYLCNHASSTSQLSKISCSKKAKTILYTEAEQCGFYNAGTI